MGIYHWTLTSTRSSHYLWPLIPGAIFSLMDHSVDFASSFAKRTQGFWALPLLDELGHWPDHADSSYVLTFLRIKMHPRPLSYDRNRSVNKNTLWEIVSASPVHINDLQISVYTHFCMCHKYFMCWFLWSPMNLKHSCEHQVVHSWQCNNNFTNCTTYIYMCVYIEKPWVKALALFWYVAYKQK